MKKQKGQSLVEVLIAIAVVSIALVAIVTRAVDAVRNSNFSRNEVLATRFAQEGIEWVRRERDRLQWNSFDASLSDDTYCVSNVSTADITLLTPAICDNASNIDNVLEADGATLTIFDREVELTFSGAPPDSVRVEVRVFWTDGSGEHFSNLFTVLSDWDIN